MSAPFMSAILTSPVRAPTVLVAPVSAEVLASALAHPALLTDVAFGTRQRDLALRPGLPVLLYVAPDYSGYRDLLRPGHLSWTGTLGAIVPAVVSGPRRGMHPDPTVRPPFAETHDYRDAHAFWHVQGLRPLDQPIAFDRLRDADGARMFGGFAPQWIACATLCEAVAVTPPEQRRRTAGGKAAAIQRAA